MRIQIEKLELLEKSSTIDPWCDVNSVVVTFDNGERLVFRNESSYVHTLWTPYVEKVLHRNFINYETSQRR